MTEDEFWNFLEDCWPTGLDQDRPVDPALVDRLVEQLEALSDERLLGFVRQFRVMQSRAYTWDLWAAGYLALGGLGDDSFMDFRSWLILHGRSAFEKVLAHPDALVELSWRNDEEDFGVAEWCSYLPARIWEQRHGSDMPGSDEDFGPEAPEGEPFPEDDDKWFRAKFPRLSAKHS